MIPRDFTRRGGVRFLRPLKAGFQEVTQRWPSFAEYIGTRYMLSLVAEDLDRTMHRTSPRVFSCTWSKIGD